MHRTFRVKAHLKICGEAFLQKHEFKHTSLKVVIMPPFLTLNQFVYTRLHQGRFTNFKQSFLI